MSHPAAATTPRPRARRWLRFCLALLVAALVLFAGLLLLPVPLRIGDFELAAYVRTEVDPAEPRQGLTYLTTPGLRQETAREVIVRVGDRSLRIAWIIGG